MHAYTWVCVSVGREGIDHKLKGNVDGFVHRKTSVSQLDELGQVIRSQIIKNIAIPRKSFERASASA